MKRYAVAVLMGGSLVAAGPAKKKPVTPDIVATVTPGNFSRNIQYNENDIPTIHVRVGYSTIIVLPDGEKILGHLIGDPGYTDQPSPWKVDGVDGASFSSVRTSKAGSSTNLNLVTASNHVYPFLLVEGGGQPDLKVVMKVGNSMVKEINAPSKWVARTELEAFKKEVEQAKREAEEAKAAGAKEVAEVRTKSEQEVADFRSHFPSSLKYDYTYHDRRNHFDVKAIAHSKNFTYLWAEPQETPALYEVKDKRPALIQFEYVDGVYIVPKVLDSGYLQIGKHKMNFKREE